MSGEPTRHTAAEMLAEARKVLRRYEGVRDFPGRERFLRETRRRVEALQREAERETEKNQTGDGK